MSTILVCGQTFGWDGQALSWDTGATKHRFYLDSGNKDPVLYESKSTGLFAKKYSITAKSSHLGNAIIKVRNLLGELWHTCFGSQVSKLTKVLNVVSLALTGLLMGPVALIASTVNLYVYMIWYNSPNASSSVCYPINVAALGNIARGCGAWVPTVVVMTLVGHLLRMILCSIYEPETNVACEPMPEQDSIALMKSPTVGTAFSVYACVGAPLIEEYLCRGVLQGYFVNQETQVKKRVWTRVHDYLRPPAAENGLSWKRFQTILKSSICFGVAHYSYHQGIANIPIVAVTTVMGIAAGILREQTGNLWAPTALHALHNTIVTLRLHGIIP